MPRKPKQEKVVMAIDVGGVDVDVYFHPPIATRKSWYVYWASLKSPKSTGARTLEEAKVAAKKMLRTGGKRRTVRDTVLTDAEFEEIQRRHFSRKQDPEARKRAGSSLRSCLEAISAFKAVTGVSPISTATAEQCERFQHDALLLPNDWRKPCSANTRKMKDAKRKEGEEDVVLLKPNTVIKWSVALRAAFERANLNAGRKCVRSVVPPEKLLTDNPWKQFSWIEGTTRPIRQFDPDELLSILDYLDEEWPLVSLAPLVAKVFLWSWSRRSEIAGLRWDTHRQVANEHHFEIVGKWGIDKWFRIPEPLYRELLSIRTNSPYVFAKYPEQLRKHHEKSSRKWLAKRVASEFSPYNLGDWFYARVCDWSKSLENGGACVHVFRKTSLQYARAGEDTNRRVAADARLGEHVMMTSYVKETDEEMRQKSNRTFERIAASLRPDVAERYGFVAPKFDPLVEQLNAAIAAQNWPLVARITAELQRRARGQQAG